MYGNFKVSCGDDVVRRCEEWRLDVQGNFQKELDTRGVLDPRTLPNYAYRDDGILIHKAIDAYAKKILRHYYGTQNARTLVFFFVK